MRKISSIDKNGKVLFVDDKGTGTTDGSEQDCLGYGFKFRNSVCYCYDTTTKPDSDKNKAKGNILKGDGNFAIGIGNKITSGINNVALGFRNLIQRNADHSIAIGKNAYAENFGEIAFSSAKVPNRAKFSFYQFDGVTTNNTATELYLGGHSGARFYINENYESGFAIDYTAVAINPSSNDIFTSYGHATYKFTNSTLTEVGHEKSTTIRDSSTNHYDIDFAPIVNTPDYIEVKVTGDTGHTVYWTVDLKVTEVRYA